jgi:hypothetical protein
MNSNITALLIIAYAFICLMMWVNAKRFTEIKARHAGYITGGFILSLAMIPTVGSLIFKNGIPAHFIILLTMGVMAPYLAVLSLWVGRQDEVGLCKVGK